MSISISCDNKIVVSAPLITPIKTIEKFINSKSGWIDKHLNKNNVINNINADILSYNKILINGVAVPLVNGAKNCIIEPVYDNSGNLISEGIVSVSSFKNLKNLYVSHYKSAVFDEFKELMALTNLSAKSLAFKDYKSRWGCCDIKNNVTLNYKLLMLPKKLRQYVIIHELCHIVHRDHSSSFWSLVGVYLPNYKQLRAQLNEYTFVNRIYQI
jgi:hypothetical protein